MVKFQQAEFLISVAKLAQLPPDEGVEVAFAGRSNAGKSSAINRLTQQKRLAKTSKTPGRTQLINLFTLDETRRLVDLPGYGYAKVPGQVSEGWKRLIDNYLSTRQCLYGVVLVMDIRHPLKPFDQQMIAWAQESDLPIHLLLNKADKLKRGAQQSTLLSVKREVADYENASVQLFSAQKGDGLDVLKALLNEWYAN